MKQITLRGIPANVEKTALREARRQGVSLNKALIALLEKAVGGSSARKKPSATINTDLDRFCGIWSRREADAFDRSLAEQRVVDAELWKDDA